MTYIVHCQGHGAFWQFPGPPRCCAVMNGSNRFEAVSPLADELGPRLAVDGEGDCPLECRSELGEHARGKGRPVLARLWFRVICVAAAVGLALLATAARWRGCSLRPEARNRRKQARLLIFC